MIKLGSKSSDQDKTKSIGYNPYLLASIQPQGGMSFQESFIRKGDGYEACVHVYSFPKRVSDFWLEPIFNMEHVITTMDVISDDRLKIRDSLNKGMAEQSSRIMNERDNAGIIEAQNNYDDLKELYNQVSEEGEVVKRIHLRHYVSAPTKSELEDKVKVVLSTLQDANFRGSIFLNEQEYEWKALLSNYSDQTHYLNKREGQPIPTIGLAGGFPFHFTSLNDPYGTFYGTTMTGGNVLFDLFHRDHQRKSFNGVMVGAMGAGKSTFLKKIMLDNAIKGYKVRTFDVTGEFAELTEALGGKQIALDGSDGVINPLQVYRTAEDEYTSFTQHLSKLTTFYKFLAPEAKDSELKEYENLLRKLYGKLGLWKEEEESNITKQSVQDYPIFSDFLAFVEDQLYENTKEGKQRENVSLERRRRLENIELNIRNVVETYANLFNGVSTMEHFDSQQVVTFTLRGLSQMRAEVFQAQLFNVLNLLWDSMLTNGAPQFEAYDRGELAFEDAVRYLILMDEAHHIINTKKKSESALDFLSKFSREARKYFGGLLYASHTIRDFVPEGSDQSMVEEIKKLFELTQYKIIMQQDSNNLEMMQQIFTGQLSQSELQDIPYLQTGETMLSIRAVENIRFKVEVSDEEIALFGGGA
ncbi:VirB4 family type IV secretion system protein [Bacillus sp. es.036]|uniref:VirB4 family type IV secretion system protein n=1 Tax=Bacillus sp. es.036 TaxID=1761764 RepID=UPI000BF60973|nr:type IV secretion system protein VirB4 [Bacillus sp. es.036]PFG14453.1 hypothetical protein ATG70_2685 [Bacillus sp. es.036]